jgi:hypothetical protein
MTLTRRTHLEKAVQGLPGPISTADLARINESTGFSGHRNTARKDARALTARGVLKPVPGTGNQTYTAAKPPRKTDTYWRDRAACLGKTEVEWIPTKSETDDSKALRICRACPVRVECLRLALKIGASGYWGGTSSYQRGQLRRRRPRVKCPLCKGADLVTLGADEICIGCGVSWQTGFEAEEVPKPSAPKPPVRKPSAPETPSVLDGVLAKRRKK